jgi:hypothetical protein
MDNSTDWIERIDRYFEAKQNGTLTDNRPFESWNFKYIVPPEALSYFVQKGLEINQYDPGDLVDFIPDGALSQIVDSLIRLFETKNVSEDTIFHICIHHPQALHPYLDRLFDLMVERNTIYATIYGSLCDAWRGATQVNRLTSILKDTQQPDKIRRIAWMCLMSTRDPAIMREAVREVETGKLTLQYEYLLKNTIEKLGFEWDGDNLRQLYEEAGYHLIFPHEYISTHEYEFNLQHPTYLLDTHNAVRLAFGGQLTNRCWRCGNPLSHILTLSPELAKILPIHSRESVEFVVCLTCMLKELFYQHDESGKATSIPYDKKEVTFTGRTIPRNSHPLLFYAIGAGRARTWGRGKRWRLIGYKEPGFMKTEVAVVPTPKQWQWQWQSGGNENRHRIGGHATWIQTAQYPICPRCGRKMVFVMQIKDQLPLANGREQYWGDVGIGYFYWCDDCAISGFISQST